MRLFDTLMNLVTGMGTAKDKNTALRHVFVPLDRVEIDAAYRSDWVARKVIDIPPHDEVRHGRDWQAENEQIEAIEAEEKRLRLWPKVLRARKLARLYGGAAIYIGAADGETHLPLLPDRIGKAGVLYLHVLTRFDLTAGEIDRDVTSGFYGEPEHWEVEGANGRRARIHPSRLVRFIGGALPDPESEAQPYWGDSVLQPVMDAVRNLGLAQSSVATMLSEAKLDVIKIPNLMMHLASDPEYQGRLQTRLTLANTLKSMVNAIVVDSEEEWDQKQLSFQTIPDVMDRYMQAAAGAADIPATRFLSQAPAGMNATGDGDYKNYLDRIAAGQEIELRPTLEPLDECIIRSALGSRPEEIEYRWAPLWQLSEKDAADVGLKKAQAFKIDVDSGLMPDSALSKARVNQLIEDGTYPGLEAAMDEAEAEGDAIDFGERAEQGAANDNPLPAAEQALQEARATGRRLSDLASFITDAEPRTLYVSRKVENAADILAWAKGQGFASTLAAGDLHVTVCYSRTPIDWMKIEPDWSAKEDGRCVVPPGGPRMIEKFGEAVVLLFADWRVMSRHGEFMRAGASHDFDDYQPHVTITYEPGGVDLAKVKPYTGRLVLGPEIFAEVNENWQAETEDA